MIKTVAFDRDGRETLVARRPSQVLRPAPGRAEQDMDAIWTLVAETIRSVSQELGGAVDFIALTAQGDGCWLVDAAGRPVGPAVLWSDGRNPGVVERWQRDGTIERAYRLNGSLSFPGLPNAILPWLREHEPERLGRAHTMLSCSGWIFHRLTGELAVDESDASAPLLDIRSRTYSSELLELFDLEWAQELLPEVRTMESRAATLGADAAGQLGLPAGTPVVMAPYDIAATAIGVGATSPGQACGILGTTLCTEVMADRVDTAGDPSGFTIAMGEQRYLRAYPSLAGTEVIGWAMRLLGLSEPAELSALARSAAPGADGLAFLPYLSPAGERAPFLDPHARGVFLGLSLEHERPQLALAVLEGLSYVIRDCLDAAPADPSELRVCGGGATSDFWCQLIADVTGLPTVRSTDSELGAKGAFITGLVATGREPDIDAAAARVVTVRDRFEPRRDHHALYDEQFERFIDLRTICTSAWQRMASRGDRPAITAHA